MQLGSARWFCMRVSGVNLVHLPFSLIGFIFLLFFLILWFLNFRVLLEELRLPSLGVDLSKSLYVYLSVYKGIASYIISYIIYSIKLNDILPSCSSGFPTSTLAQSQSESFSEGKGCSDSELKRVAHIEGDGNGLPFLIEHSKQPKILNRLQNSSCLLLSSDWKFWTPPPIVQTPLSIFIIYKRNKFFFSVFCVLRGRNKKGRVFLFKLQSFQHSFKVVVCFNSCLIPQGLSVPQAFLLVYIRLYFDGLFFIYLFIFIY